MMCTKHKLPMTQWLNWSPESLYVSEENSWCRPFEEKNRTENVLSSVRYEWQEHMSLYYDLQGKHSNIYCNVSAAGSDCITVCIQTFASLCICVSVHLCTSEACKILARSCEDIACDIYNFLKCSAKVRAKWRSFKNF